MAKSAVIINPKDVLDFSKFLNQYNQELLSRAQLLNSQFKRLGETWKDQDYQEYSKRFMQEMSLINKFLKISNDYYIYLAKLAERARDV